MLGAIASLVVYLCGLGHMVVVAHARCEHGEFVHGSHEHESEAHGSASLTEDSAGPAAVGSDDSSDQVRPGEVSEDHGHCDPFAVTPGITPSVATSCADVRLLDGALLPWSVRASVGVRTLAILSLAPKSSPPV
jgi:hypothetical protein